MIPDLLFIEGNKAFLVNPLPDDASACSFGGEHSILEGRYAEGAWRLGRVQVAGYDLQAGEAVVVDSFIWPEIDRYHDRLRFIEDNNISAVAEAEQRGRAILRKVEIQSAGGYIRTPVNCGQQMYDVIDITDGLAGMVAETRRVLGIDLIFNAIKGTYEQRLYLGAV